LKRLKKLGASSGDILAMEDAIARAPESGAIIRGTNGLREVRFGFGGRGKSGGGRTIIMWCRMTTPSICSSHTLKLIKRI
jgi:hypothetical protein